MPGVYDGLVGQLEQLRPDRLHDEVLVAERATGGTRSTLEQGVAGEDAAEVVHIEADRARRMAGRVQHLERGTADLDRLAVLEVDTGDIAPISRNGVMTTGCRAAQYSNCASSIRSSQRSGELQLISEMLAGVCSILSRPPKRIELIAMVSTALGPETTLPM